VKVLRVDLTTGRFADQEISKEDCRKFLGGRGLAAKILYEENKPRIDAFDPENRLIFMAGPYTGTQGSFTAFYNVTTKAPLTGAILSAHSGGHWGPMFRKTGYDGIVFKGKSPKPVYLLITDKGPELKDASDLWGRDVFKTIDELEKRHERSKAAVIGPAGEKLVRYASIMNDMNRAAGRGGVGAVMGSKNLKAVAALGTGQVNIADVEGFRKAVMEFYQEGRDNGELYKRRRYGTWGLPGRANASKTQAAFNFKEGYFAEFAKYEDPEVIIDLIRVRDEACFSCPFGCSKRSRINDPEYPLTAKGPEHETMALVGSNCGLGDMEDICRANYLCNELGMDTITTGAMVSCAMELFEEGYLPEKDLGFPLEFGNKNMFKLLKQIAHREGIGELMAQGGVTFGAKYGHPELFMGIKGMGIPAWHPQALDALGLQYATCNTGGAHTKSTMPFYEGRKDPAYFVEFTKKDQDYLAAADSGILCWIIYHGPLWGEKLAEWLTYVTGTTYTPEGLEALGERIWNLERLFNMKAGITGKDDTLPPRILKEPRVKNRVVVLDKLLPEYYERRGWDQNGVPTREKLKELALEKEGAGVI